MRIESLGPQYLNQPVQMAETPLNGAGNFDVSLEGLDVTLGCRKDSLLRFMKKNLREGVHFIQKTLSPEAETKMGGGHNRVTFFARDVGIADLLKSSYNLKHKYVPHIGSLAQVKTIMTLENQTIGFICSALEGLASFERQHSIGIYKVDLCFEDFKLVVECDEHGHVDRCPVYEQERTAHIEGKGYQFVRFDPNCDDFDLAPVLRRIISIVRPM